MTFDIVFGRQHLHNKESFNLFLDFFEVFILHLYFELFHMHFIYMQK